MVASAENSQSQSQSQSQSNNKRKHADLSLDDVQDHSLSSKEVEQMVDNLENVNDVSQIDKLQKKLHSDYRLLAKEFSTSRISRIDAYLKKIEEIQAQLRKNVSVHETYVKNSLPLVDEETGVEDESLSQRKTSKRKSFYQGHINEPSSPVPDPPLSPVLEPLAIFPELFEKTLEPFKGDLKALRYKYRLEARLIEDSTRKDVELTWRQSIKDMIETRRALRKQITDNLYALENDYYNLNKYEKMDYTEKRYRMSTRKVGERHRKTELVEIEKDAQKRFESVKDITNIESKPVSSISEAEAEADVNLIKFSSTAKIEMIEANHLYFEQPSKKPHVIPTTMTDLVNHEIEEKGISGIQFQMPVEVRHIANRPILLPMGMNPPSLQQQHPQQIQMYPLQPMVYNPPLQPPPNPFQFSSQQQQQQQQHSGQVQFKGLPLPPPPPFSQQQQLLPPQLPSQGTFNK